MTGWTGFWGSENPGLKRVRTVLGEVGMEPRFLELGPAPSRAGVALFCAFLQALESCAAPWAFSGRERRVSVGVIGSWLSWLGD